jgi:processive 1,2-diacylglycerol beta-glucosyltransferase
VEDEDDEDEPEDDKADDKQEGDRQTTARTPWASSPATSAAAEHALAMARKHGLDPVRWRILVTASGFGVGPVERLVGALLDLRRSAQLVVICGRSAELKQRLDALAATRPADSPVTLRAVGYTRAMDEYMAAADLLVGKPGGLT